MNADDLAQLEKAAIDVMSPPNAVSAAQRAHSAAVFLNLRKLSLPYEVCKHILEHTRSDYVLFEAASTLREAVVREWSILSLDQKNSLRHYLMAYIMQRPSLAKYVREQLVVVIAVTVKRDIVDDPGGCQLFQSLLSEVSHILSSGDHTMQQLSCSLLRTLLTELSSSTGSSSLGLPLEYHQRCKKIVEGEGVLLKVLLLALQVLQQCAGEAGREKLTEELVSLLLQILSWDYRRISLSSRVSPNETSLIPLRPPKGFAVALLDPNLLELLFKVLYLHVSRPDDNVFHNTSQCVIQLASLNGTVFSSAEEERIFVSSVVKYLISFLSTISDLSQQAIYVTASVLRRLAANFPPEHFVMLEETRRSSLVHSLTHLSVLCCQRLCLLGSTDQEVSDDQSIYEESLEHLLEVWIRFVDDTESFPPHLLEQPCLDVFTAYLQSKLTSPLGWRSREVSDDSEVVIEVDEDDRTTYADQLSSIGLMGRYIPSQSLPLLLNTLSQRISDYFQLYKVLQESKEALYSLQKDLDTLHEDLHWLILVSGYTLCTVAEGEETFVPKKIMEFCISEQDRVRHDVDFPSLVLSFTHPGESVSVVVGVVSVVCQWCVLEKVMVEGGLGELLSPQVCESAVWFLSCVAQSYLMLNDQYYKQVSLSLVEVFGVGTQSAQWLLSFLLDKVVLNFTVWASEEQLLITTAMLLTKMTKSKQRSSCLLECDAMWSLMRQLSHGQHPFVSLAPAVQRQVVKALVWSAVGSEQEHFLKELTEPLSKRFMAQVHRPNFASTCHDSATQLELLSIVEVLCGLTDASTGSAVQLLFPFLLPLLNSCVSLMEAYSNTQAMCVSVLTLFNLVSENFTIFLEDADVLKLYEVCLALIQVYAKCNTGKYSKLLVSEEDQCEDLVLFLSMLTNLTTRDYLDFTNQPEGSIKPVEVVLSGLKIVLPLLDDELLKFPTLCQHCYQLLNYVCEIFPDHLFTLSDQLFLAVAQLLERGLTCYGGDICRLSVECVESIAACSSKNPSLTVTHTLEHFLKLVFEQMLSVVFDTDLLSPYSGAVFMLICAQQELYVQFTSALLSSVTNPDHQKKLLSALQSLTPPSLQLDNSQNSKRQFKKNMQEFLPDIRGCVCLK